MGERARVKIRRKHVMGWLIDWYHHPILSLNRCLQFHVSIDWNDWVLRRGPSREKLCLFCARLSPHPFLVLSCWRLELWFFCFCFSFLFLFALVVDQLHPVPVLFCWCMFPLVWFFVFFFFLSLISSTFSECCFDVPFSRDFLRRVSCESFDFRARLSFFFCLRFFLWLFACAWGLGF